MALIHMIEASYPDLWQEWLSHLVMWQEKQGLPADWISEGRWRIKEGCTNEKDCNN
jgi:hypothetical protein